VVSAATAVGGVIESVADNDCIQPGDDSSERGCSGGRLAGATVERGRVTTTGDDVTTMAVSNGGGIGERGCDGG